MFTIIGTKDKPHVVRLFPKESCPSTTICYHILAAKMSIGMETKESCGRINLTQLRRNTRQRRNKKSGRKGRFANMEITQAPDAVAVSYIYFY